MELRQLLDALDADGAQLHARAGRLRLVAPARLAQDPEVAAAIGATVATWELATIAVRALIAIAWAARKPDGLA